VLKLPRRGHRTEQTKKIFGKRGMPDGASDRVSSFARVAEVSYPTETTKIGCYKKSSRTKTTIAR
jgi:hypothetical protein